MVLPNASKLKLNMKTKRELIIVGDRVLVEPDDKTDKTSSGLFLPPTVKEKNKIMGGRIIKVGPGYPVHDRGNAGDGGPDPGWRLVVGSTKIQAKLSLTYS